MIEAIQHQAATLAYAHTSFFSSEPVEALAEPYALLLSHAFSHVSPALAYRDQGEAETADEFTARLARELEAEFQQVGPGTVAAFVAEAVVGATSGCVPAPVGYFRAVLASNHVVVALRDESGAFQHGHTYLADPIACAAALAVQQVIQEDGLLEQVQASATYLEQLLQTGWANTVRLATYAGGDCFAASNWLRTGPRKHPSARRLNCMRA